MTFDYNLKVVDWSDRLEITQYVHPICTGKKTEKKARTPYDQMSPAEQAKSDKRREMYYRKRIRELCLLAIENQLNTFITLTFADEVTDYDIAKHEWELFLKRLKYRFPEHELVYLAVHELQRKRASDGNEGVYHFHVLTNIGFFPIKDLQKIWRNGFCFIEQATKGQTSHIAYLFKYVTKDILADEKNGVRSKHRLIYLSRNIKRPRVTKELSVESLDELIWAYLEKIDNMSSYTIKNHNGVTINHANCITVKK